MTGAGLTLTQAVTFGTAPPPSRCSPTPRSPRSCRRTRPSGSCHRGHARGNQHQCHVHPCASTADLRPGTASRAATRGAPLYRTSRSVVLPTLRIPCTPLE
ncbi:hypothetical protein [Streptomyces sp.]|uniref:hypothetical protein n=1 Tax=Streptomyces sp. TaxID=1931 RepID=UPI0039C9123A